MRIPFVRRCQLEYEDGVVTSAFIVNISVLGAYIGHGDPTGGDPSASDAPWPVVGQRLVCRFPLPEMGEVAVAAKVNWVNLKQQHPVHSLPPGYGLQFLEIEDGARVRIESIVVDYAANHPEPDRS